jgi:3-oxoacyl-[acyl-carrier protein] reductase
VSTGLETKRAIVTGAGSGIGRATARALVREGARVGLIDIDRAAVTQLAEELEAAALPLPADVRDERQVQAAVAEAVDAWAGLDIVVGAAGISLIGNDDRADRLELEVWQRTIDVNLTGMFLAAKHGIRALLGSGGGSVVLVCSPTGQYGCSPGADAYSSSKAGVYGLVRVMAADYADDGIRVNGVIPGYTATPMTAAVSASEHEHLLATIPLRRAGLPEEVAEVIAFLASDRTPYVTGSVWAADGGMPAI